MGEWGNGLYKAIWKTFPHSPLRMTESNLSLLRAIEVTVVSYLSVIRGPEVLKQKRCSEEV